MDGKKSAVECHRITTVGAAMDSGIAQQLVPFLAADCHIGQIDDGEIFSFQYLFLNRKDCRIQQHTVDIGFPGWVDGEIHSRQLFHALRVKFVIMKHPGTVTEYQRDLSVMPSEALLAYYCNAMNVRKRQVICDLSQADITLQAGAMQWMAGNVNATTGVKGVGDFFGKALRGSVTGESAIKPEYTGDGTLVLEPTYKHILLMDVGDWNGSIVLDDGLFLACDAELKHKAVMRSNLSSAIAGNEGLFNLGIVGRGVLCLESPCPKEELIEIELNNDVLKIDGNMAIAWSGSLDFTVERSGKTLIGSAASGEGLVNVYRGTGRVLMAPVAKGLA